MKDDEVRAKYTKKEIGGWEKESQKLGNLYGGVAKITKKPDALFVIDSHLENLAVREALAMHVPTVAIVDTNADPSIIDYPIPANDDAVGSIKLIVSYIIDAWMEGRNEAQKQQAISDKKQETEKKKETEKTEKSEKEQVTSDKKEKAKKVKKEKK